MLICKKTPVREKGTANDASSDGSTPQKQTEQILAVTPILRGQLRIEKNPIPPPHTRSESSTTIPKITASHPPPQPSDAENDLIDFGQNDSPAPQMPTDLHAAQTNNNGQQQKNLEHTLRSTSTERKAQGSLIDFHDDLKRDLPTMDGHGAPLKRHDTDTSSLDEFVDAEG